MRRKYRHRRRSDREWIGFTPFPTPLRRGDPSGRSRRDARRVPLGHGGLLPAARRVRRGYGPRRDQAVRRPTAARWTHRGRHGRRDAVYGGGQCLRRPDDASGVAPRQRESDQGAGADQPGRARRGDSDRHIPSLVQGQESRIFPTARDSDAVFGLLSPGCGLSRWEPSSPLGGMRSSRHPGRRHVLRHPARRRRGTGAAASSLAAALGAPTTAGVPRPLDAGSSTPRPGTRAGTCRAPAAATVRSGRVIHPASVPEPACSTRWG